MLSGNMFIAIKEFFVFQSTSKNIGAWVPPVRGERNRKPPYKAWWTPPTQLRLRPICTKDTSTVPPPRVIPRQSHPQTEILPGTKMMRAIAAANNIEPGVPRIKRCKPAMQNILDAEFEIGVEDIVKYCGVMSHIGGDPKEIMSVFAAKLKNGETRVVYCPFEIKVKGECGRRLGTLPTQMLLARNLISQSEWAYLEERYKIEREWAFGTYFC